jgi:hypothetical protein
LLLDELEDLTMRAHLIVPLLALAGLTAAQPAAAHGHHHMSMGVNMGWSGGWYGPGWYGGGWWYGPGWYAPAMYGAVPTDVGVVDTDISPEHARVYLDGALIGTADDFDGYPSYLFLKPGRYTLEFKLQGYAPESLNLEVAAGRMFPLDMKMARVPTESPAPWYDRPEKPAAGRVYEPVPSPEPQAPSGPDPRLRPELLVEPGAGERPAASTGAALDLKITPSVASVYLDGQFVGTAGELSRLERGLAVAPGNHQLEVMAPGHEPRSVTVEVQEGQRQQVVVELDARARQS